MAVVVDLDALRHLPQRERGGHPFQQPALRRRVGELAAKRLARVGQRMRDQFLFLAALRHRDFDFVAGLHAKGVGKQCRFLDLMRQQDEFRRRLVVVELREERGQHFLRRERLLRAREIGAVAPVLAGAEEEHFDAGIAALLMDGEHVGFFYRARIDALLRLDRRQRGEAITIQRRGLEFELGGCLLHLAGEQRLHGMAAAGQEIGRLAHQLGIAGEVDLARAGARTAADLIQQARPGAALEKTVGAGADQEGAL